MQFLSHPALGDLLSDEDAKVAICYPLASFGTYILILLVILVLDLPILIFNVIYWIYVF